MDEPSVSEPSRPQPRWRPLAALDRRVAGVLVEKAKTTPDAYPMTINGICTAANQKNNRHPLMQIEPDDAEESLERLRELGAVAVIQGSGRVSKYRHLLYEWLGVDKVELAVMAELLLRGAQTEGELRGRAARMEPIADLSALRPVLESLRAKGLVQSLSPAGRGQVISHALYQPQELEKLHREHSSTAPSTLPADDYPAPTRSSAPAASVVPQRPAAATGQQSVSSAAGASGDVAALRESLADLRREVAQMSAQLAELTDEFRGRMSDLDRLQQALGG